MRCLLAGCPLNPLVKCTASSGPTAHTGTILADYVVRRHGHMLLNFSITIRTLHGIVGTTYLFLCPHSVVSPGLCVVAEAISPDRRAR